MRDEYYSEDWARIKKHKNKKKVKKGQNHKSSTQIKYHPSSQNQVTMPRISKNEYLI